MKKAIILFLTLFYAFLLTSCGADPDAAYKEMAGKWIDLERTYDYSYLVLNEDRTCGFYYDDELISERKYEISENYVLFYDNDSDDYFINNDNTVVYDKNTFNGITHIMNDIGTNFVKETELETTEVEINKDNWREYFELECKPWTVTYPGYSKPNQAEYRLYITLKDDIAKRLVGVPDGYDYGLSVGSPYGIRLGYTYTLEEYYVRWNPQTETFDKDRLIYEYDRSSTKLRTANQYDFWSLGSKYNDPAYTSIQSNDIRWISDSSWKGKIITDVEVESVDGKLLLYNSPVYMYNINTVSESEK